MEKATKSDDNPSIRSVLSMPVARYYLVANLCSLVGSWTQQVTVFWLAWRQSESLFVLSALTLCGAIPVIVLSPFAGILADRGDRARLLLYYRALALFQALLCALLEYSGNLSVIVLVIMSLLLGLIDALSQPASQSFITTLVNKQMRGSILSLNSIAYNLARFIGPSLGGWVIHVGSFSAAFMLNVVSYIPLLIVVYLASMQGASSPAGMKPPLRNAFLDSAKYLFESRTRSLLLLELGVLSLFVRPLIDLLPSIVERIFTGDARLYGAFLTMNGAGAILAGILMSNQSSESYKQLLRWATICAAIAMMTLGALPWTAIGLCAITILGFALFVNGVGSMTLLQQESDDTHLGRVTGFYFLTFRLGIVIGSLLYSFASVNLGVGTAVFIGGALCAIVSVLTRTLL